MLSISLNLLLPNTMHLVNIFNYSSSLLHSHLWDLLELLAHLLASKNTVIITGAFFRFSTQDSVLCKA